MNKVGRKKKQMKEENERLVPVHREEEKNYSSTAEDHRPAA
jgi:hypothetical protein